MRLMEHGKAVYGRWDNVGTTATRSTPRNGGYSGERRKLSIFLILAVTIPG
jgi:hypothetical protein